MVQHLQHTELRRAQPEAGDTRPRMALDGVERPGQDDPQLQRHICTTGRWLHDTLGTPTQGTLFRSCSMSSISISRQLVEVCNVRSWSAGAAAGPRGGVPGPRGAEVVRG